MTFLTSNHCPLIYNIAFSSEKVDLSESGKKYAQIKHRLQFKTHLSVDFIVKRQQGTEHWRTEALKEALLWIMDLYFDQNQEFKIKVLMMDLFLTNIQIFASHDVYW